LGNVIQGNVIWGNVIQELSFREKSFGEKSFGETLFRVILGKRLLGQRCSGKSRSGNSRGTENLAFSNNEKRISCRILNDCFLVIFLNDIEVAPSVGVRRPNDLLQCRQGTPEK
jgi:hypothetical protein